MNESLHEYCVQEEASSESFVIDSSFAGRQLYDLEVGVQ